MDSTINGAPEVFMITGNWTEQTKGLKRRFSELTDADLDFVKGKENELILRMESRLNRSKSEIINILKKGHISNR